MDSHRKSILVFLTLATVVSLAVGFRSFFKANIIGPIVVLCWAVWRIISSVNQNIYWMILIVVCLMLVIRLIPAEKDNSRAATYNYIYKSPNRVEYWQTLIKESVLRRDEAKHLRDNLKRLLVAAFARGERSRPTDLEEIVATRMTPLSLRARGFLFPPKEISGISFLLYRLDVLSLIPKRLERLAGKLIRPDTAAIDEILEQIEIEMEINHDR